MTQPKVFSITYEDFEDTKKEGPPNEKYRTEIGQENQSQEAKTRKKIGYHRQSIRKSRRSYRHAAFINFNATAIESVRLVMNSFLVISMELMSNTSERSWRIKSEAGTTNQMPAYIPFYSSNRRYP